LFFYLFPRRDNDRVCGVFAKFPQAFYATVFLAE